VGKDDVFDVARVHADFLDIVDDMIDERLLRRVEEDVALRRRQQPHRHVARSDQIQIVEHLGGFDVLIELSRARVTRRSCCRARSRRPAPAQKARVEKSPCNNAAAATMPP
jgi:hypothetical protein